MSWLQRIHHTSQSLNAPSVLIELITSRADANTAFNRLQGLGVAAQQEACGYIPELQSAYPAATRQLGALGELLNCQTNEQTTMPIVPSQPQQEQEQQEQQEQQETLQVE